MTEEMVGPVIFSYTRQQALSDGVLVDVTATAHEAGFRCPVALTATVWGLIEAVPPAVSWQDRDGRLWDVLWMAFLAARRSRGASYLTFEVILATLENTPPADQFDEDTWELDGQLMTLKAVAGPGDHGEMVVTIMLPGED